MRILVVGSCTKSKQDDGCPLSLRLTEADFEDTERLRAREQQLTEWTHHAADMYTGRQHTQMMEGVRILRSSFGYASCQVAIISAGYGLINEKTPIAPYDITFHGMHKPRIRDMGMRRGIPESVREKIVGYPLIFLLLGDDYLLSIRPPLNPAHGQKIIAFGSARLRHVPGSDVVIVPADKEAAQEFHDGITTVKGKMFNLLAKGLVREPSMWDSLLSDRTRETVLRLIRRGGQLR